MIILYILLGLISFLLAVLLFLLYVNVHIIFDYHDKPRVTVRVLFFRLDGAKLYRYFESKGKKKKEVGQKKQKAPTKKKSNGDLLGFVEFIAHITKVIRYALREHFSKCKVNLQELQVSVGADDAAQTAYLYSAAYQGAISLCALLQHFTDFRCDNRNLSISPDFSGGENKVSICLDMTVKSVHVSGVLLRSYYRFFEGKGF